MDLSWNATDGLRNSQAARGEEGRDLLVLGVLLFRVDDLAQRALEDGAGGDGLAGHGRAALLVRLLARALRFQ